MNRTAVPSHIRGERPTDPQIRFIRGLFSERDRSSLSNKQKEWLAMEMAKAEDEQFVGVSVKRASDIITALKNLPVTEAIAKKQNADKPDVPAGRYAVESDEGELRFYKVWVSKKGYIKVYVLHGPDSTEMPYKSGLGILRKIESDGVEQAAIRFGQEIGACSNCGRRLTNRISRELGIGPICGGRMFGDEFVPRVADARERIVARGEDPYEEIDDDQQS